MNKFNGEYCIVRGDRSGVFAGNVEKLEGQEAIIRNVRRLWYWNGAASISQLAMEGTVRPKDCQFSMIVDKVVLTDVIEINFCTEIAEKSIKEVAIWKK